MSALLEACGLCRSFGGLMAVCDVSLAVGESEIMGLIGPNGAGKTTIFNLLTGLCRPDCGQIFFGGQEITGLKPEAIARLGLARTFQNIRLFSGLSLLNNVRAAGRARAVHGFWPNVFGSQAARDEDRTLTAKAWELLELTGLAGRGNELAGSLPYGERRRLEIARALALSPRLLLLDEPAAGLNPAEKRELGGFIRGIKEKYGLSVLIIEHNVPLVMGLCDRVMVLNFGQSIALGTPENVQRNPEVIKAYLGDEKHEPA